jgi:hypothetical protein
MVDKVEYVDFLTNILRELVNHPDEVKVTRSLDEMGVLLRIKVNPQDMGLVIGRRGELVKAIKTIMRAVGLKYHARINVKLEEPSSLAKSRVSGEKIIEELKK